MHIDRNIIEMYTDYIYIYIYLKQIRMYYNSIKQWKELNAIFQLVTLTFIS